MKFENKLKLRCSWSVFCFLLGVATIILSAFSMTQNHNAGYIAGVGGGLIGASVVILIKNISVLRNKTKMQHMQVEAQDERNLLISYKAGAFAFKLSLLGVYIWALIMMFTNFSHFQLFFYISALMVVIYLICYIITKKSN